MTSPAAGSSSSSCLGSTSSAFPQMNSALSIPIGVEREGEGRGREEGERERGMESEGEREEGERERGKRE